MPQDADRRDVIQAAAKATTLREVRAARRDLVAYTEEYGKDPLVWKLGEQTEMLERSFLKKEREKKGRRTDAPNAV